MYRLTLPEIRVLKAGHVITKQRAKDEQKGVEPKDRANLKDFNKRLNEGDL